MKTPYLATAITNIGLIILTGFSIYYTHSLWSVIILFGLNIIQHKEDKKEVE